MTLLYFWILKGPYCSKEHRLNLATVATEELQDNSLRRAILVAFGPKSWNSIW